MKNKILRKYRKLTGAPLADKLLLVAGKMTGNPNFKEPDVDLTLMTATANQSHSPALVTGSSITNVTNVASTKLGIEVVIDPHAWAYEIQTSTVAGVRGALGNLHGPA